MKNLYSLIITLTWISLCTSQECNGVFYLTQGNKLSCSVPTASTVAIPNSNDQRNIGTVPTDSSRIVEFIATDINGRLKTGLGSVSTLFVDAATYGLGVQVRISYDFEGDGNWDSHEILPHFATDAVTGQFERYQVNGGSNNLRAFNNGRLRVQAWQTYNRNGGASFRIGGNDPSRISVPFEGITIGNSQPATSATPAPSVAPPVQLPPVSDPIVDPNCKCGGGTACCGEQCYDPKSFSCPTDANTGNAFLCPSGFAACSRQCYDPKFYHCTAGGLRQGASQVNPPVQTSANPPATSATPRPTSQAPPATSATPAPTSQTPPVATIPDPNCRCGGGMACCGEQCYDPKSFSCPTDSNTGSPFLCPSGFAACSRQCYDPKIYHCTSGGLRQGAESSQANPTTPRPTSQAPPATSATPAPSVIVPPVPVPQTSATPAPSVVAPPVPVPQPSNGGVGLPDTNARWSEQYGANAGDVVIPAGRSVLFDMANVRARTIRISQGATLVFDHRRQNNIQLTTEGIYVSGALWIGSLYLPFEGSITITLTGNTVVNMDGREYGTKAFAVGNGGVLEIHGAKGLGNSWVHLAQTATRGSNRLVLSDSISGSPSARGWKVGDQIIVAGTDYSPDQTEKVTITRIVDSKTLEITPALRYYHHGTITMGVDERAEVGLLSRTVRIVGTDDNVKGGQMIFLRGSQRVQIEGIELENMGQSIIARYPIHFHMAGDQYDSWVRHVSVHNSNFRCVTIHGTNGVQVADSVMFNNPGHCIYLEDGVEVNNVFARILVTNVLEKKTGERMGSDLGTAVSGFWITHPGNTFRDNVVVGSPGAGYWVHVRNGARGLSKLANVKASPNTAPFKEFKGNKGVGCDHGFQIEATHFDGANFPLNANYESPMSAYTPLINGKDAPIYLDDFVAHHNRFRGLWARANVVYVRNGAFSNNMEAIQLATSGDHPVPGSVGYIDDSLIIGWTDNIGNDNVNNNFQMWNDQRKRSWPRNGIPMVGVAFYDGPQVVRRCVFDGWRVNPGEPRHSAIGTRYHGEFQVASTNSIEDSVFRDVTYKVFVSDRAGDGGKAFNFRIKDNSMGTPTGVVLPVWNFYRTDGCISDNAVGLLCPQKYAQMWVIDMRNKGGNAMTITRNEHPGANHNDYSITYNGFHSAGIWRYQPLVSVGASYLVTFRNNPSDSVAFQLNNAEIGNTVGVAVCYPRGSTVRRVQRGYSNRIGGGLLPPLGDGGNVNIPAAGSKDATQNGDSYSYDAGKGILYFTIKQRRTREDYNNFCPSGGCDFVHVEMNLGSGSTADCINNAYSGANNLQITSNSWLSARL